MKNRVNHYWRIVGSGISFSVFGLGTLLLSLFFFLIVRLVPVSRDSKHRWILASIKTMCGFFVAMMRFFGLFSLRLDALHRLPAGGHLIIANHPSLIDALFIAAHTDNLCCVVKSPLIRNPFTSYIVRLAGYIPNQSETLLDDACQALSSGKNLLVFPEGTRNTRERQLEFKRGAANIALFADCPITPVLIEISPRMLEKGSQWYQMPARPAQIIVSVCSALNPSALVDRSRPITLQARELNHKLIDFYLERLLHSSAALEYGVLETELKESAG